MAERSEPVRSILFAHEPHIRLAAYLGVFAGMAAWELILPRRKQVVGPGRRLPNNLGVVALDTLLVRILFPTTAVVSPCSPRHMALDSSISPSCRPGLACLPRSFSSAVKSAVTLSDTESNSLDASAVPRPSAAFLKYPLVTGSGYQRRASFFDAPNISAFHAKKCPQFRERPDLWEVFNKFQFARQSAHSGEAM